MKRKVNLANVFGDADTYLSIAKAYEDLEEWSKSGDFYAKANAKKKAIEAWWKGTSYERAWGVIVQTLAPSPTLGLELLLIELLTKQRIKKADAALFREQFGVDHDEGWDVLKDMNLKLADLEFTCSESKQRVAKLHSPRFQVKNERNDIFNTVIGSKGSRFTLKTTNLISELD